MARSRSVLYPPATLGLGLAIAVTALALRLVSALVVVPVACLFHAMRHFFNRARRREAGAVLEGEFRVVDESGRRINSSRP